MRLIRFMSNGELRKYLNGDKLINATKWRAAVDAVPVVRCKDCKFFSHGYCRFHDAKFVRPDGYCYWGEQKEGEQHGTK